MAVAREAEDVVIAADTIVVLGGRILGKPRDTAQAFEMLRSLSERMDALEEKLNGSAEPEGYPAWAAWDGISDKYQFGAIVSHNGKLWKSVYAGQNVWEPGVAGINERFWVEYTN